MNEQEKEIGKLLYDNRQYEKYSKRYFCTHFHKEKERNKVLYDVYLKQMIREELKALENAGNQ